MSNPKLFWTSDLFCSLGHPAGAEKQLQCSGAADANSEAEQVSEAIHEAIHEAIRGRIREDAYKW